MHFDGSKLSVPVKVWVGCSVGVVVFDHIYLHSIESVPLLGVLCKILQFINCTAHYFYEFIVI